jgi:hypothetical protein
MLYRVDNPEVLTRLKRGDQIKAKVYEGDITALRNRGDSSRERAGSAEESEWTEAGRPGANGARK